MYNYLIKSIKREIERDIHCLNISKNENLVRANKTKNLCSYISNYNSFSGTFSTICEYNVVNERSNLVLENGSK